MKNFKVKGRLLVSFDVVATSQSKAVVLWKELMEVWKKKGYQDSKIITVGSIQEFSIDDVEEL